MNMISSVQQNSFQTTGPLTSSLQYLEPQLPITGTFSFDDPMIDQLHYTMSHEPNHSHIGELHDGQHAGFWAAEQFPVDHQPELHGSNLNLPNISGSRLQGYLNGNIPRIARGTANTQFGGEPNIDAFPQLAQIGVPSGPTVPATTSGNESPNSNTEAGSSHTEGSPIDGEVALTSFIGPKRPHSPSERYQNGTNKQAKRLRLLGPQPQIIQRKRQPRQPFRDPEERRQTGYTRRVGACVRCRAHKIRVRAF